MINLEEKTLARPDDRIHANAYSSSDATQLSFLSPSSSWANQDTVARSERSFIARDSMTAPAFESSAVASVVQNTFLAASKHPTICLLHIFFKFCALITYELGYFWFGKIITGEEDFIFSFVTTTVFLALDFWVVKNLSGRILVGMRWWNEVTENGISKWRFECAQDGRSINSTDARVFWIGNYAWSFLWIVLAFFEILHLQVFWFLLCSVGIALSSANVIGYRKCSVAHETEAQNRFSKWASAAAMRSLFSRSGVSR